MEMSVSGGGLGLLDDGGGSGGERERLHNGRQDGKKGERTYR